MIRWKCYLTANQVSEKTWAKVWLRGHASYETTALEIATREKHSLSGIFSIWHQTTRILLLFASLAALSSSTVGGHTHVNLTWPFQWWSLAGAVRCHASFFISAHQAGFYLHGWAIFVKPQQWPTPSESIAIYCVRKLVSCITHLQSCAKVDIWNKKKQILLNDTYKLNHCKEMGAKLGRRFLKQPAEKLKAVFVAVWMSVTQYRPDWLTQIGQQRSFQVLSFFCNNPTLRTIISSWYAFLYSQWLV